MQHGDWSRHDASAEAPRRRTGSIVPAPVPISAPGGRTLP
jgi:hypothetical protein